MQRIGPTFASTPKRSLLVLPSSPVHFKHLSRRVACTAIEDEAQPNEELDEHEMRLALQEAAELLAEAEEMAQAQVMQELLESYVVEKSEVNLDPSLLEPLSSYWLEQGFSREHSKQIAQDIFENCSRYSNVEVLSSQMQRLRRVIPFEVEKLVAKDVKLLQATPSQIAEHFVELVTAFEGQNLEEIVGKQPRLLYCDNLTARVQKAAAKLLAVHPSHDMREINLLLVEYPELVFRMEYYMHVRTVDELPIEIQNMMIVTGQGLSALHRMYQKPTSYPTGFNQFVV